MGGAAGAGHKLTLKNNRRNSTERCADLRALLLIGWGGGRLLHRRARGVS
jgi:hypothetical protein